MSHRKLIWFVFIISEFSNSRVSPRIPGPIPGAPPSDGLHLRVHHQLAPVRRRVRQQRRDVLQLPAADGVQQVVPVEPVSGRGRLGRHFRWRSRRLGRRFRGAVAAGELLRRGPPGDDSGHGGPFVFVVFSALSSLSALDNGAGAVAADWPEA